MKDRGLPMNPECERAVLGAVLLDNSTYFQAAMIGPDHFGLSSHQSIFKRMSELAESGRPVDYNTLTEQLGQHKEIESVGGTAYLMSLTDGLPRVKNIEHYVRIVREKYLLRQLIHTCNANEEAAYDQAESAQSIIARSVESILGIQGGSTEDPKRISEFSDDVIGSLKSSWDNPEKIERYTLGLPEMTQATGGMLAEEYGCIMGRTGDGKTGYASQIALENGLRGRPVLIFPLELSKEVMLKRLLCQLSKVSNRVIIKHTEDPLASELEKIRFAKRTLDELPIFFDDTSELTPTQFAAKARQWKRRHCKKDEEGLVIVDYIQKFAGRYKDLKDRVTAASESSRRLAKDERMRVLVLSQMGRPEGKNMNARPTKFDPKESGSIENDVHVLVSAFRPVDDNKMPTGMDELVLCKQRDGESAIIDVEYRGPIYTFIKRQRV